MRVNDKQRRFPCKRCGAQRNQPCRTYAGKATEYHAVRNYDAEISQYAYTYVTKALSKQSVPVYRRGIL